MNRVFKTTWNVARQLYTVTDEHHASKGKSTKSTLALIATAVLLAGTAQAAYVDPGIVATNNSQMKSAIASWETAEYQKDWGLTAMHASTAYALGFHGQNTAVGVMDSGALLQKHPELAGERFHASHAAGVYGSTGNRYQVDVPGIGDDFGNGGYTKGEAFDIDGNFVPHLNDTHGTHVTGTVGANRDGSEFHGVSWGSNVWVGNSGGTDNTNYGPFQDHDYFYTAWKSLATDLIAANGEKRGGVINNSFGTNLRFKEKGTKEDPNSFHTDTTAQTEHEYFLFKKKYGEKPDFVDAAWEAVKGTNVVQVMTTGNRNFANPYYRPLYPYFNPEAEQNWIAVAGLMKEEGKPEGHYIWIDSFNEAGNAKWWTVVGPGDEIYSSVVYDDHYEDTSAEHPLGTPGYASYGGTSMAAPHVTGAMGVLMSRYQDMSAVQARTVLFTTANHKNVDGSNFTGWTAEEGTPDVRYGWGVPDLAKGMYGPGQFLGSFNYVMDTTALDVWTNDVSQVALDARKVEDQAWMTLTENGTKLDAEEYDLGTGESYPTFGDASVTQEQATAWRQAYYTKRAKAIQDRLDKGEYNGSLVKDGAGKLVLTGNNTYRGGTTVKGGTLLGFTESFGESNTEHANGKVVVEGGIFGLLSTYTDTFTQRGELKHSTDANHNVDVELKKGTTLLVAAGQTVDMGKLSIAEGVKVVAGTDEVATLKAAYKGEAQTGKLVATEVIDVADEPAPAPDAARRVAAAAAETPTGLDRLQVEESSTPFFRTHATVDNENRTITATIERDESTNFATYAGNANETNVANAIEAMGDGALFDTIISSNSTDAIRNTYASLSDDFYLTGRNAYVVNGLTLSRAIMDQATGIGEGRKAEMVNGHGRIWATGVGDWTTVDRQHGDVDSDFYAGVIGMDADVTDTTKLGVFFGAGSTDLKSGSSKVDSDDVHVGLYGMTTVGNVASFTYGAMYSHLSEDNTRMLQAGTQTAWNKVSGTSNLTQLFAEGAYTGLNTAAYSVEPYVGVNFIHATTSDLNETVAGAQVNTAMDSRNLEVVTLGVRGALPITTIGTATVSVKGNVGWSHLFGDTEAEASMSFGGASLAHLQGEKLDNLFNVGVGLEAQWSKSATFGLSYTGAYNSDVKSHGMMANVRFRF